MKFLVGSLRKLVLLLAGIAGLSLLTMLLVTCAIEPRPRRMAR